MASLVKEVFVIHDEIEMQFWPLPRLYGKNSTFVDIFFYIRISFSLVGSSMILGRVGFGKLYLMYLEDTTGNIVLKVRRGY